jgi:hypothetical protein
MTLDVQYVKNNPLTEGEHLLDKSVDGGVILNRQ